MNLPFELVKNEEVSISESEWTWLNDHLAKQEIIDLLSNAIAQVEFPFRKISLAEAKEEFAKLCKLDTRALFKTGDTFTKYPYSTPLSDIYIDKDGTGGKASDFFHQRARFKCDSLNAPSPHRVWSTEKFRKNMLKNLWTMTTTKVDSTRLLSAMSLRNYVASQFRPSAAKAIYTHFSAKRVYDFSTGWGDRLCGFLASEQTQIYHGCDPNKALHAGYHGQVDMASTDKQVLIAEACAETWRPPATYDLVFTSPPYFDIERYSRDETQSWIKYKGLDNWLNGFLFPSIQTAWHVLEKGGHLVVNIADVYGHKRVNQICDPMNSYISTLPNARFLGMWGYRMAKRPNSKAFEKGIYVEPVFIWRKL